MELTSFGIKHEFRSSISLFSSEEEVILQTIRSLRKELRRTQAIESAVLEVACFADDA